MIVNQFYQQKKNIYDALILISTLFKTKGIVSGTYKGKDAKGLLNQLCSCSLHYLEEKINQLNFDKTIRSFIEQFNILLFTNEISKVRASYAIEQDTDFDPIEDISKIKSDLFDARAAYQYLIEKTLSLSSKATFSPSKKDIESLLGLAILRNRFSFLADMIHYSGKNVEITLSNLDGLHWKVDSSIEESLAAFSYAKTRLEVTHKYDSCSAPDGFEIQTLQKAFLDDTGFQMDDLLGILKLLTTPVRCSLFKENKLLYSCNRDSLLKYLCKNLNELSENRASKVVDFLTLQPSQILSLPYSEKQPRDVPTWECKQRPDRYILKPLIKDSHSDYLWGSEHTLQCLGIWSWDIFSGFLPAHFEWPNVNGFLAKRKKILEKHLETKTYQIIQSFTKFTEQNIDFYRRFSKQFSEDVGDFDVLAFFPNLNLIVCVECKYNKPIFSYKDHRVLFEEIYGREGKKDKSHICKILWRKRFLEQNRQKILELLKWKPLENIQEKNIHLYVSHDLHMAFFQKPDEIPIEFLSIQELSEYLQKKLKI